MYLWALLRALVRERAGQVTPPGEMQRRGARLGQEEHNYAYALKLKRDGWVVEEVQADVEGPRDEPCGAPGNRASGNEGGGEFTAGALGQEKPVTLKKQKREWRRY